MVTKTIYYDPTLSKRSIRLIEAATQAWTDASEGAIQFDVKARSYAPDIGVGSEECYKNVLISEMASTDPVAIAMSLRDLDNYPGIPLAWTISSCDLISVVIFSDLLTEDPDFYKVTMHELGHVLGLRHYVGEEDSLMRRYLGDQLDCPTAADFEALCAQYDCTGRTFRPCTGDPSVIRFLPGPISP